MTKEIIIPIGRDVEQAGILTNSYNFDEVMYKDWCGSNNSYHKMADEISTLINLNSKYPQVLEFMDIPDEALFV